jgi:hypothetical protein
MISSDGQHHRKGFNGLNFGQAGFGEHPKNLNGLRMLPRPGDLEPQLVQFRNVYVLDHSRGARCLIHVRARAAPRARKDFIESADGPFGLASRKIRGLADAAGCSFETDTTAEQSEIGKDITAPPGQAWCD